MKKIIGVVLLVALTATSVFAQVSTGLQFRQRVDVFSADIKKGDKDNNVINLFKQNHKDNTNVAFSASTENAGVNIQVDFDLNAPRNMIIDTVTGWFRIGGLKLTGGKFASRFTNRIIQDLGRALGLSYLRPNYGVDASVNTVSSMATDGDNMGHGNLATTLDYTFDLDFAKLLVKGSLFAPEFNSLMQSGFGFEAAFQMDMFSLDLVAKFPKAYNTVIGAYFQMLPVDLIQFAVGFTLGLDTTNKKSANTTATSYGIDGRVRIKPIDPLAVTVHANFSQGIVNVNGTKSNANFFGLVGNVTFDINDMFAIFGEVAWDTTKMLKAQVGPIIRPVENAKLAASVQLGIPTKSVATGETAVTFAIPVVFDIAL